MPSERDSMETNYTEGQKEIIRKLEADIMKCREEGHDWTIQELMNDASVEREVRRRVEAENKRLKEAARALWRALGNSPAAIGEGPTPELEMYKWVNTTEETTNAKENHG